MRDYWSDLHEARVRVRDLRRDAETLKNLEPVFTGEGHLRTFAILVHELTSTADFIEKFLPARPTASDAVQSSAAAAKPDPGQVGQAGDVAKTFMTYLDTRERRLHDETGDPRKCAYCATHHAYIEPAKFIDVGCPAPGTVFINSEETKRDLLARLEAADNEIRRGYTVTDVDQGIELGFKTAIDTVRRYFE